MTNSFVPALFPMRGKIVLVMFREICYVTQSLD